MNGREDVRSQTGVEFHFFELGGRQLPRFIQNVLGNRQFTHIVKKGSGFHGPQELFVRDTEIPAQAKCIPLNSPNVTMCDLVLRIDGHGQCFNC
jgi:hypothetical protein